jgi:uncharacterized membrane protein (DUF106 family)
VLAADVAVSPLFVSSLSLTIFSVVKSLITSWQAKKIIDGERKVQELLDRAREHERKASACHAELANVEKTITELDRQKESIRELMLVP